MEVYLNTHIKFVFVKMVRFK